METVQPRSPSRREEALDGVRLLLTILVVLTHSSAFYPAFFQHLISMGGSYRIPALYALSGFVLYLPTAHLDTVRLRYRARDFWQRRAWRLLPAYWAMLIIASLRCLYVALREPDTLRRVHELAYVWKGLLWHIPLAHGFSGDTSIIVTPDQNVSWTLAYECALSACLPLFIWTIARIGWWPFFALIVFINTPWGYSLKLLGGYLPDVVPSGYILIFVCGMFFSRLAKYYSPQLNPHLSWYLLATTLVILAARFLYLPLFNAHNLAGPWKTWVDQLPAIDVCLVGLSTSAFCAFQVLHPQSLLARAFSWKPVILLAPLSYCIYLIHVQIFTGWNMLSPRIHVAPRGSVSLTMCWSLTLLSAYALHRWVEMPFHKRGNRIGKTPSSQTPLAQTPLAQTISPPTPSTQNA